MSKYITHFQTEAAYQSALPTLDLPNVSLVDELGEVHYHRALYGAHAGDICLYDVAEAQKIFVTAADWNLTSYPTASYPIIGIAIADESLSGVVLCSALGMAKDGSTTNAEDISMSIQGTTFDWGLTKYQSGDDAKTDFNGKTNTATIIEAVKAYDLSHSTDNFTNYAIGAIQEFYVTGTNKGDWYLGAAGEVYNMCSNSTIIKSTITKIRNANSSLAATIYSGGGFYKSTTEKDMNYQYQVNLNTSSVQLIYKSSTDGRYRPFYKLT